jgi:anti-sigma factor RsiW
MMPRVRRQRSRLSCREVGRLLHAYLDNELNDARAVLLADHLDACLRCGLDASSYRWLKAQLADLEPRDDPAQLERLRGFAEQLIDGASR